jgi:dihydrofolate reductase
MTRFVYATAVTLDGFLADADHGLDWLFAVDGGDSAQGELAEWVKGVGVMVEGSSTYQWVLDHEALLEHPEKWQEIYEDLPTFVFSSRSLPVPAGADVRVVSGDVAGHLDAIRAAADGKDVWLVGGGELVGQFLDAGALDEVHVSIAAVTLGAGAPLLPRRLESDRLRLKSAHQVGQFIQAKFDVLR